ncbi:PepSY domain-containing protein [Tumebacillus sp. ITR2]|uniref:PepSY domain-containing protein n=1 Tax=Tumebacillus amylolyticus TaxID=2801339 RepID=A0ABS1JAI9_9BACL|nr:PepSY domain-containing protein [Tumebacillus amylolyticus]MBL0387297.1 PepSY domain-containing protein [Tumebacillus amylolyticus]
MKAKRWLSSFLALAVLVSPLTAHAEPSDQMSPSEHRELKEMTDRSGGTIQVKWDEKLGTPRFISGKLSKPLKGEPFEMALTFLDSIRDLYHVDKAKKSFALKRVDHDELGMQHVRLTHVVNGIPVWGDEIIVHIDKSRVVRSINGQFTANVEQNSERLKKPTLDAQAAIKAALADVKVEHPDAPPQALLHYFAHPEPDQINLVYIVNVYDKNTPADWKVFVDAMTGDILYKYNDIKTKKK